jgi:hypothetical protein
MPMPTFFLLPTHFFLIFPPPFFLWRALMLVSQRGTEGSTWLVCLIARPMERGDHGAPALVGGSVALPPRCLHIVVQRCRYCVQGGGTLAAAAKLAAPGADWLALWVANGNDDGDSNTATVQDPDVLVGGDMMQVHVALTFLISWRKESPKLSSLVCS